MDVCFYCSFYKDFQEKSNIPKKISESEKGLENSMGIHGQKS